MKEGDAILRALFVSIWVLAVLHMLAQYFYLYWLLRWLDMPMHFLGGMWVGGAVLWMWHYSGLCTKLKRAKDSTYVVALVGGMSFGLVWELCDYLVWTLGVGSLPEGYVLDTLGDLSMDIIGVHVAYVLYAIWQKRVSVS